MGLFLGIGDPKPDGQSDSGNWQDGPNKVLRGEKNAAKATDNNQQKYDEPRAEPIHTRTLDALPASFNPGFRANCNTALDAAQDPLSH